MQPLVQPKVHRKLLSKLLILCCFYILPFCILPLLIWRKSWWSSLFWWNRSILQIFFFLHSISFVIGENSPAMHGRKEIVFMSPHLYFFSLKHFRLFVFVKKLSLELFLSVIASQNLKIYKKISSHAWLVIAPWENFFVF